MHLEKSILRSSLKAVGEAFFIMHCDIKKKIERPTKTINISVNAKNEINLKDVNEILSIKWFSLDIYVLDIPKLSLKSDDLNYINYSHKLNIYEVFMLQCKNQFKSSN